MFRNIVEPVDSPGTVSEVGTGSARGRSRVCERRENGGQYTCRAGFQRPDDVRVRGFRRPRSKWLSATYWCWWSTCSRGIARAGRVRIASGNSSAARASRERPSDDVIVWDPALSLPSGTGYFVSVTRPRPGTPKPPKTEQLAGSAGGAPKEPAFLLHSLALLSPATNMSGMNLDKAVGQSIV